MLALLKPSKKSVLKQENFGSKRVYSPSSFCCFLGKSALYDVGIMSVFCQNELLCDEKNESGPCLRWIPSFNVHIIAVPLVGHYAFSLFCSHGIPVSRPPPKKKDPPLDARAGVKHKDGCLICKIYADCWIAIQSRF